MDADNICFNEAKEATEQMVLRELQEHVAVGPMPQGLFAFPNVAIRHFLDILYDVPKEDIDTEMLKGIFKERIIDTLPDGFLYTRKTVLQIGELIFKLTRNSERHCPKKTCSLYRIDSVRLLLRKELKKKRVIDLVERVRLSVLVKMVDLQLRYTVRTVGVATIADCFPADASESENVEGVGGVGGFVDPRTRDKGHPGKQCPWPKKAALLSAAALCASSNVPCHSCDDGAQKRPWSSLPLATARPPCWRHRSKPLPCSAFLLISTALTEEDKQVQASLVAPIPPTLVWPEWSQSVDSVSANGRSSSSGRFHGEFQDMAHCLSRASGSEQLLALQSLCEALQDGGHDAAERACAAGTVEVSLGLLRAGAGRRHVSNAMVVRSPPRLVVS
ncbi:hypothetical protein AK812_SmicGene14187 [Symbiodinium microadriaticum]|uniref:Uncharacterized protein n=1 Tax=Symbiodinium microadriaticum TaxID=2951 RepID=A0A1Q9E682_SYMMI|nr:hypothetical protein AK812_SmicGene14187 [Symbiodinium microadriaticum]